MVGKRIDQIDWPPGSPVAALVRNFDKVRSSAVPTSGRRSPGNGEVEIAHHDTVIQPEDHVIVFCTTKKLVKKVEKTVPGRLPFLLRGRRRPFAFFHALGMIIMLFGLTMWRRSFVLRRR